MQLLKIVFLFIAGSGCLQSCIKEVDVETRSVQPILVVEGSISTDTVPYNVKLTYSGPARSALSIPDEYLEKEAVVSISDDQGKTATLVYKGDGVYETTDATYIGKAGRSYSVQVILKDGKTYSSAPEKMKQPIPISRINVNFVNKFDFNLPTYMNVSIDAEDPGGEENFYRWTSYSWITRRTKGVSCGFGCIMYEYCYQLYIDQELHLLSDRLINGQQIRNQTVGRCYIYTYANPYISIDQESLTREAYEFWSRYRDQLTRTGGILDPLPAAIKGNVFNAKDNTDFALGYFSAISITRRKAILVPYSITPYLLELSAKQFILPNSVACFDHFPNTLFYPSPPAPQKPPPPGWENAEEIKVYW